MSLKTDVINLLDDTITLCDDCNGAGNFKKMLVNLKKRLNEPLRVAVVGIMKAGKSTFMNALMGDRLVYTGTKETTYTVCWFKYGDKPYITICFKDGTEENAEYSELKKWSIREYADKNPRMKDVKYLIIHYPNEILKTLEFIDTPGLNSIYKADSANTMDFLEIKRADKETRNETSAADAVIYAFSREMGKSDGDLLDEFHKGSDTSSPINSIGILTKIDCTGGWKVHGNITAVEAAKPVLEGIIKNKDICRLLYSVYPVCAKPIEGIGLITDEDWKILAKLSEINKDELADLLFEAKSFRDSTDECYMRFGEARVRKHLVEELGQYGIMEVCGLLKQRKNKNEIPKLLSQVCGIDDIRQILSNHFGNRTFLIKTQFIFNQLRGTVSDIRKTEHDNVCLLNICSYLENRIDELMTEAQTLNELRILQYYYNGQLKMSDEEVDDFMHITGEYGREPEMRLNIASGTTMREMMEITKEKIKKWHTKASAFMMTGEYVDAAATIARSYEYVYHYLSALCEE